MLRFWCVPGLLIAFSAQPGRGQDGWDVRPNLFDRESVLPNSQALVKSLGDAAEYVLRWKPPADGTAWARRRPEVEAAFREALGLTVFPERTPLKARSVARHDLGEYVIENVVFESRPGFPVTCNLYRPKGAGPARKRPAILSPIGHFLGAGKTMPEVQARCIGLVRMGFIVLTYDAIGQGERMSPGNIHHEAGYALMPLGDTIAGWMVWDSMRAIDYLLTLDDVDPDRIGITGNSGGGLNSLFTAALDPRIRAAVVVGYTFQFNHWIKYAGAHCTCTHLPALFRSMEWFEIAGLIAPRALLMLQGENDRIFPIEGARRAARDTVAVFSAMGRPGPVRFDEVPGEPHAYSKPYRERMYGWMALHLTGRGNGEPAGEVAGDPLGEGDRRLLCDPDRSLMEKAPSVIELARERAMAMMGRKRPDTRQWVAELTAAPDPQPHQLSPEVRQRIPLRGGTLEKISFVSEEGQYIPGLLWLPDRLSANSRTIVITDERGKSAVAESGLLQSLLEAGHVVLAIDLRGRGETLGRIRSNYDTNFRLVYSQVLLGRPLAGRRAFDVTRAVDYLARRKLAGDVTVVGLGDDALPALLAAAVDQRIRRVAAAGYLHSFLSQMQVARARPLPNGWNDPQLRGRVHTGKYEIDFGSVIPGALHHADVPDIVSLIAPRRVLFCQARDHSDPGVEPLEAAFRYVAAATAGSVDYRPDGPLDAGTLREWLAKD